MSFTKIDFDGVRGSLPQLNLAVSQIETTKHTVDSIHWQVDENIRKRANIENRFRNILNYLADVEYRIQSIKKVCADGVSDYENTNQIIKKNAEKFSFDTDLTLGALSAFAHGNKIDNDKNKTENYSKLDKFINKDFTVRYDEMIASLKKKGLSLSQIFKTVNKWYDNHFNDEGKKLSKAALKAAFGSKTVKAFESLDKIATGQLKGKDYIDIVSLFVHSGAKSDAVLTTFKSAFTYVPKIGKMDAMVENYLLQGDFVKAGKTLTYGFNKLILGGVVDVGAKVIDHQFHVSETFAVLEIATGYDFDGNFNRFTSTVNNSLESKYGF